MKVCRLDRIRLASVAAAASLLCMVPAKAQQSFNSPDDAASALATAVRSGISQDVLKVLGAGGEDIIDSGDDVADKAARDKFLAAYDARHSVKVDGKKASLIVDPRTNLGYDPYVTDGLRGSFF